MTDLGTVAGDICTGANSINSEGQIVGFGSADCNNEDHAFVSENGGPILDLQSLIPSGSGLTLINAIFINDRGEIAARAKLSNGDEHAVVLIPCDGNHLNVEGCDYGLVDAAAAARKNPASVIQQPTTTSPRTLRPFGRRGLSRRHFGTQTGTLPIVENSAPGERDGIVNQPVLDNADSLLGPIPLTPPSLEEKGPMQELGILSSTRGGGHCVTKGRQCPLGPSVALD
jgi:probable HAF family extracellular repeat protein